MQYLETQQKAQQFLSGLTMKAWESPAFKEQLINNPVAAISEFTGKEISLPADKKIVVSDQTDNSVIYINIAGQPNVDDMQLTEEELELIAGGVTPAYVAGALIGIGICWAVDRWL